MDRKFCRIVQQSLPSDPSILQNILNIREESDEPTILADEVRLAINHLKKGKSPGYDGISAEEFMATGKLDIKTIRKLYNKIRVSGDTPHDWGGRSQYPFSSIYKKKVKLDYSTYMGISLLSLAGKVFCSILHKRIQSQTQSIVAESQAGFRPGITIDQLFTLRQIAK